MNRHTNPQIAAPPEASIGHNPPAIVPLGRRAATDHSGGRRRDQSESEPHARARETRLPEPPQPRERTEAMTDSSAALPMAPVLNRHTDVAEAAATNAGRRSAVPDGPSSGRVELDRVHGARADPARRARLERPVAARRYRRSDLDKCGVVPRSTTCLSTVPNRATSPRTSTGSSGGCPTREARRPSRRTPSRAAVGIVSTGEDHRSFRAAMAGAALQIELAPRSPAVAHRLGSDATQPAERHPSRPDPDHRHRRRGAAGPAPRRQRRHQRRAA